MTEITKQYKLRTKMSICRGKSHSKCKKTCKYASGPIYKYCRKTRNKTLSTSHPCVNKTRSVCKKMSKCVYASGTTRKYCRRTRHSR